jgi:hypothetical protein
MTCSGVARLGKHPLHEVDAIGGHDAYLDAIFVFLLLRALGENINESDMFKRVLKPMPLALFNQIINPALNASNIL